MGGDGHFWELILGGGVKRGLEKLVRLKMEVQIGEEKISSKHLYSCAIYFFKLFLALLYVISLCDASNWFSEK